MDSSGVFQGLFSGFSIFLNDVLDLLVNKNKEFRYQKCIKDPPNM